MEVDNKKLFKQIKEVLQEQKLLEKKLNSITKSLNINEQQLNESSNFLLSTSKQLFFDKIELIKEKKFTDDIFITANAIIVIFDSEGYIKRFNSFAEKITGYKEVELIGLNWFEHLIPKNDRVNNGGKLTGILKNKLESNSFENKIISKDGTIKRIDWACTVLDNGIDKEELILNIGIDITKRKNSEDTLEKERKLFSAGPVAILTWLPEKGWPVKYVSSNIKNILGYTVEEMISPNFKYTHLIHEDDIEWVSNEVSYNNENNIDVFEQSYRLKHKNGQYRWFYNFTNFIRNEHNKLIEVSGYMFDQTILKHSENKLEKALEKAEESDKLKSAFMANISHEIRTPLNGILGVVNLIANNIVSNDELEQYKDLMNESSARLINTINNIVEISQISSNQVKVSLSDCNLNTLINEVYKDQKNLAEKNRLAFSINNELPDDEAIIVSDYDMLKTILSNFVNNAIKFTKTGSILMGYRLIKDNKILYSLLKILV